MWFARFPSDVVDDWSRAHEGIVWLSEDGSEGCSYLEVPSHTAIAGVVVVRLAQTQSLKGDSHGRDALWHYVVATDVLPEQEADFNAWYGVEHLPGLAAVPGVVHAARYRVIEGTGPAYLAGYELADRAAFNSPPWLAVRGTAWSSRVRPYFFNTRRTMYRRVA